VPRARVVVLSGYVRLLELGAGADAYVAKGDDERELLAVIRRVVAS